MMKHLLFGLAAMLLAVDVSGQIVKDEAVYESVEGYTLTNIWNRSRVTKDLPKELDIPTASRGMAVYNDKIYVTYRYGEGNTALLVYDTKNGAFLKQIELPEETYYSDYGANDIQVDDAGHLVISNMTTGLSKTALKLWVVDPEANPATAKEIFSAMSDDFEGARIDYMDVAGDVTKDGIVMAPIAGTASVFGNMVLKWNIKNGVVEDVLPIEIKAYYPENALQNNTAPRVCIVNDNLFYLDGFESCATLYDVDGNIVSCFGDENVDSNAIPINVGNNGVDEFEYNGNYYVIYISSNTAVTPPQVWNLSQLGPDQTFAGMKLMYQFPKDGMGNVSNGVRTALPRIVVKEDGVYIYLFATNNGLAAYKFATVGDGIDNTSADNHTIIVSDGYILAKDATEIEVFTVDGKMTASAKSDKIMAPTVCGLYIVKAMLSGKQLYTQKIIVK